MSANLETTNKTWVRLLFPAKLFTATEETKMKNSSRTKQELIEEPTI